MDDYSTSKGYNHYVEERTLLNTILEKIVRSFSEGYDFSTNNGLKHLYISTSTLNLSRLYRDLCEHELEFESSAVLARVIFETANKSILCLYDNKFIEFIRLEFALEREGINEHLLASGRNFKIDKSKIITERRQIKSFLKSSKVNLVKARKSYSTEQIIEKVGNHIEFPEWKHYYHEVHRDLSSYVHQGFKVLQSYTKRTGKLYKLNKVRTMDIGNLHRMVNGMVGIYCKVLTNEILPELNADIKNIEKLLESG